MLQPVRIEPKVTLLEVWMVNNAKQEMQGKTYPYMPIGEHIPQV
jgi:hypothetical protein